MRRSFLLLVRTGSVGLGFIGIAASSGCRSQESGLSPFRPRPDVTNVVQKPVYPVEGTKPLYLGGYAGGFYGSTSLRGGR
jgi:hypothetical protein